MQEATFGKLFLLNPNRLLLLRQQSHNDISEKIIALSNSRSTSAELYLRIFETTESVTGGRRAQIVLPASDDAEIMMRLTLTNSSNPLTPHASVSVKYSGKRVYSHII